jgi:putative hydroxymethylpyrimidine transport system substrate-binding protein
MRRVAALLAVVLGGIAIAGCGDDAEPGAPEGATTNAVASASLVLDFQPNAVHAGLYAGKARGGFADEGIDLEIREPSGTADGAKLLEAGKADYAILDVADFEIARERGLDLVAIAAIVQRPLAAVIAADGEQIETPADLDGKTVGVTGVPSDDVVLDTVLASAGLGPEAVERQTIGFNAVPLLLAGELDAATAFWNAEGVELKQEGAPTREFRVDEFGAARYPELIVAARADTDAKLRCGLVAGLERGYEQLGDDPEQALEDLLAEVPELDPESQQAQLDALVEGDAFPSDGVTPDGAGRVEFAGC